MDARLKSVAAAAGVVVSALCLTGCEKLQQSSAEADRAAVSQMQEGKFEVAAKEKDASPAIRAAASSQLATQRYQQGVQAYGNTLDRQIEVMRLAWRANHFAALASENIEAAKSIGNYEPTASLEKADQIIGDIRGASDKMSRTLESAAGVDLATITSLEASIEKLNHDIGGVQKEIADLESQRQSTSQRAQELSNKSADAKGQQAVDLFRQSAEARKTAADLATRIDATKMRLVPLQQNLATAMEQKETLTASIAQMDSLKEQVRSGWEDIRKEAGTRNGIAESIAGKQAAPGQMTLLLSVKEMEGLGQDLEAEYTKAAGFFDGAAAAAGEANAAAQQAVKRAGELATVYRGQPEEKIYKNVQTLLNAPALRVNQLMAEYSLGRTYADWSGVLKIRQEAIAGLQDVSKLVKQNLPQEVATSQLGGQQREMAAKATESLKKTGEDFASMAGGSPETIMSAGVGRIATQLALAELAEQGGDASRARGYRDAAQTAAQDLAKNAGEVQTPDIVRQAAR